MQGFVKQKNIVINNNLDELAKYHEQRREIKAKKEVSSELSDIKNLLLSIQKDLQDIKAAIEKKT